MYVALFRIFSLRSSKMNLRYVSVGLLVFFSINYMRMSVMSLALTLKFDYQITKISTYLYLYFCFDELNTTFPDVHIYYRTFIKVK